MLVHDCVADTRLGSDPLGSGPKVVLSSDSAVLVDPRRKRQGEDGQGSDRERRPAFPFEEADPLPEAQAQQPAAVKGSGVERQLGPVVEQNRPGSGRRVEVTHGGLARRIHGGTLAGWPDRGEVESRQPYDLRRTPVQAEPGCGAQVFHGVHVSEQAFEPIGRQG